MKTLSFCQSWFRSVSFHFHIIGDSPSYLFLLCCWSLLNSLGVWDDMSQDSRTSTFTEAPSSRVLRLCSPRMQIFWGWVGSVYCACGLDQSGCQCRSDLCPCCFPCSCCPFCLYCLIALSDIGSRGMKLPSVALPHVDSSFHSFLFASCALRLSGWLQMSL